MTHPYDVLEEIRKTSGNNAKMDMLRKYENDVVLCRILYYMYNPFHQYYIRKIPKYERSYNASTFTWDQIFSILNEFRLREVTGNAAIEKLSHLLSYIHYKDASLVELILKKDSKTGLSTTFINRVLPNLIPKFEVMLADANVNIGNLFSKYDFLFQQKKSDGKRMIVTVENRDEITFLARSGKSIDHMINHDLLVNGIKTLFNKLWDTKYSKGFVLDGEVIMKDENGKDYNRKYSNGRIMRKELPLEEIRRFHYEVWDIVPLNDFVNNTNEVPYETRFYDLLDAFKLGYSNMSVIETFTPTSLEEVMEINTKYMQSGYEGSVVKTPDHFYETKRSKSWIKIKNELECDLKVVQFNYGQPGTKYETMLGALVCESSDGKLRTGVGSGFSDELRKILNPKDIVGKIVTVKYNEVIDNKGSDIKSLYLPVFLELRDDKDVADTLVKIIKESKGISK